MPGPRLTAGENLAGLKGLVVADQSAIPFVISGGPAAQSWIRDRSHRGVIPKLRALINSAHVFPATGSQKGVPIYVSGKLANMLALATGKDVPSKYMVTMERAKGFEPSTPTLARLCSTPELRPLWRLETGRFQRVRRAISTGFLTRQALIAHFLRRVGISPANPT
ncbi:protein of unknown function [uncultured Sphingopyxis sp.]|uniref:Uncharacterized protein n=1 Tax=uncultured Sphingopyxis sp. TaxID=310581 RepID=A0A1Y5PWX8_9SPHN|nr:protein of unknown function [uncultured Sphingopyxis sp.]